ncbi:MAG TPA: hypothetical protein VGH85_04180 [Mycobacteriales bacterium]|jgi:cell division protein FtsB
MTSTITGRRTSAGDGPSPVRRSLSAAMPASSGAPRRPFVILIVALLVAGLVLVLLINTANAGASFRQSSLQQRNDTLGIRQQQLAQQVDTLDTPQSLSTAARRLGMVPGGDPAFLLLLPDGASKVLGSPAPATAPPPPPPPPPDKTAVSKKKPATQHRGTAHPTGHPTGHPTAHSTHTATHQPAQGGHR